MVLGRHELGIFDLLELVPRNAVLTPKMLESKLFSVVSTSPVRLAVTSAFASSDRGDKGRPSFAESEPRLKIAHFLKLPTENPEGPSEWHK